MNEFIRLPQAKIFSPMPSPELIFVTGGRAPSVEWLLDCASSIAGIWSIDHGIDVCHRAKLAPQLLIGDLDSARSESIAWAKSLDIPIEVHPVDKDFTDTQLALDRAAQLKNPISVVITGAFGGRVDHLFATLFTCAHSPVRTILADEREVICFIRSGESIKILPEQKPFALSLLPMTEICRGVSIDGVHWKLNRAKLHQSFPNAVSNRVEASEVRASIESGILAVHLFFDR